MSESDVAKRMEEWQQEQRLALRPREFYYRFRIKPLIVSGILLLLAPFAALAVELSFGWGVILEILVGVVAVAMTRYAWRQKAPDRTDRIKKLEEQDAELDRLIES